MKDMEKQCLYDGEYLRTEYSENGNYLIHTWRGHPSHKDFCELIDKGIATLKEKKAKGFILDVRKHKGIGDPSQEYAAKSVEKFVKDHYPIKQAIIVPVDIFSRISVENYSKKIGGELNEFEVKYFDNLADAEVWLMA